MGPPIRRVGARGAIMAEPIGHLEGHDFQPGIRLLARLARVAEQAC